MERESHWPEKSYNDHSVSTTLNVFSFLTFVCLFIGVRDVWYSQARVFIWRLEDNGESQFSTLWVPGMEFWSLSLVASAFTC